MFSLRTTSIHKKFNIAFPQKILPFCVRTDWPDCRVPCNDRALATVDIFSFISLQFITKKGLEMFLLTKDGESEILTYEK